MSTSRKMTGLSGEQILGRELLPPRERVVVATRRGRGLHTDFGILSISKWVRGSADNGDEDMSYGPGLAAGHRRRTNKI
jgi:hypothetical protein